MPENSIKLLPVLVLNLGEVSALQYCTGKFLGSDYANPLLPLPIWGLWPDEPEPWMPKSQIGIAAISNLRGGMIACTPHGPRPRKPWSGTMVCTTLRTTTEL